MTKSRDRTTGTAGDATGSRLGIAAGLAGVGVVMVVAAILMGNSVRGLSLATGIHLVGVLAIIAGGIVGARSAIRFAGVDGRGWPLIGLAVVFFLVSAGWLVERTRTESAAGDLWAELVSALESEDAAAAPVLVRRFDEVPEPGMRVDFVRRLGELRDPRASRFLFEKMNEHPEAEVRENAAIAYGGVASSPQIDQLVEELATRADSGRELVLAALRTAAGRDLGPRYEGWLRWRLEALLEDGTPEAIEALVDRMGRIAPREEIVYRDIRARLAELSDPRLRITFEKILRGPLSGSHMTDRRALAVQVLGRIALPASIEPLKAAIRWARTERDREKMRPEEAERFWETVARSLRAIAGKDLLDAVRFQPVFEYFVSLLADDDEIVRNFAADQLEALSGAKHGLDAEQWARWQEDGQVAAYVAAKDSRSLVTLLRRVVAASDLPRSARVMDALAAVGDDVAGKEMRGLALRRGAPIRIRSVAVDTLRKLGRGISRDDLLGLLEREDDIPMLRSVVEALGAEDAGPVAEALHERYLVEEDGDLRRTIVSTLCEMTADAVFGALVDAVRDEVPAIQEAAAAELGKRTGKRFGLDADKWAEWYERSFK